MGFIARIKINRELKKMERIVGKERVDWALRETIREINYNNPPTAFYDHTADLKKILKKR